MKDAIALRQERQKVINEAKALVARAEEENRDLSDQEKESYDRMDADIDKFLVRINRIERMESLERDLKEPIGDSLKPDTGDLPTGDEARTTAELRGYENFLQNGKSAMNQEFRALQADADIYGGFVATPPEVSMQIIKAVDNALFFRQLATTFQVPKAESLGAPALDNDPADSTWTAEIGSASEDSTMSFGKRELKPHPLRKLLKVSETLIRKGAIDVVSFVTSRLAYKTAVPQENAFMNGTGSGQPLGIFAASSSGISTGRDVSTGNTTTSIAFDGLIEAKYSIKTQYWMDLSWIFHRDAGKQIRKLKDGEGRYIWESSVKANEPDTILGRPVYLSEYAPNTFTTGLYVGCLGAFSNYWIADALNIQIKRLDELYARTNQIGFIVSAETDGLPVLEEAFARITLA